jgi:hypothetical protein
MSYTRELLTENRWSQLTSQQQHFFLCAERDLTPALNNLVDVINKHSQNGNNDLLIESGVVTLKENRLLEEGMFTALKGLGSAAAEKFRKAPQTGHLSNDAVTKLFRNVVAQHGGTDVVGIKKAFGDGWKELKDTDQSEILKSASWVNKKLDDIGGEAQKIGAIKDIDNAVDNWIPKLKQKYPKLADITDKIGNWAKDNPGKSALAIAVLAAAVNFAGAGLVPAIAVGMLLRTALGQMKNPKEKFSSSLGQAAKLTGAALVAGPIVGAGLDALGGVAETIANAIYGVAPDADPEIVRTVSIYTSSVGNPDLMKEIPSHWSSVIDPIGSSPEGEALRQQWLAHLDSIGGVENLPPSAPLPPEVEATIDRIINSDNWVTNPDTGVKTWTTPRTDF